MIEQNISYSVNNIEGTIYYISLANMIKLNNQ